jgi:hypothetical protein
MNKPIYRTAKLAPRLDLGAFDCGEREYNQWLNEHATQSVEYGLSMVYLLLEKQPGADERVIGYFAICPTSGMTYRSRSSGKYCATLQPG